TIHKLPKYQIELEVILPFAEFEPHVKRAAVALSEERDIDGFRKGKAPYDAVKNKFGEHIIYERAAEHAVRKTYPALIERFEKNPPEGVKEFLPIGSPEITIIKLAPGNEFIYKAKLSLMPHIELPDYSAIAKRFATEKKDAAVTDDEIAKTLEWIRESRMQTTAIDRAAQDGDGVEVDFEIRHGGVKWEGGESKNHPLVIGKKTFIPGFEQELIGMKAGEEKNFSLTLPHDWHDKALAGKAIDVHVTVKLVLERTMPELTDEFVKQLGAFDSVDALKKNISMGLLQEKKDKERQRVRVLIIEAIAKEITIEVPDVLVERECDKMIDEVHGSIEQMGMKWEDYLLHIKKTIEELRAEWRTEAQKRVRVALTLHEIAAKENINPTLEEIEKKSNEVASQYGSPEDAQKQIDPTRLREYTKGILRNEKVFEFLESIM
ncbi:MAG: trigger factor, partial [Patescibacteria group bacterium]